MHILIVTDQHPDSLGGAQVAIRAQRTALEALGHRITIAAPAMHRRGRGAGTNQTPCIELPSLPITTDREYSISFPGYRTSRVLATALRPLPPVDVVHVQGDFWGAMIGVRAARGLGTPLVLTMHNNVHHGTRSVTPLASAVFAGLRLWRAIVLGSPRGTVSANATGAWKYLAELAAEADAVIAPSRHFADALRVEGVTHEPLVVRGGVDDTLIARTLTTPRTPRDKPVLVWLGRMSHEKRVLQFIDALALAQLPAKVQIYGSGLLETQVRKRISSAGLQGTVSIEGLVTHDAALAALRDADALVQTSIGFETQGLTPFEAAALGTPTVFCDPQIAQDANLSVSWIVPDDTTESLAATLTSAVQELAAAPTLLRVPERESQEFLQSVQTKRLLEIYEQVLRR